MNLKQFFSKIFKSTMFKTVIVYIVLMPCIYWFFTYQNEQEYRDLHEYYTSKNRLEKAKKEWGYHLKVTSGIVCHTINFTWDDWEHEESIHCIEYDTLGPIKTVRIGPMCFKKPKEALEYAKKFRSYLDCKSHNDGIKSDIDRLMDFDSNLYLRNNLNDEILIR